MTETPISLAGPNGTPLFGILHEAAGPCRAIVVTCHPLFEEKKSAHRVFVDTARRLAAGGFTVLRFDYACCGDSGGDFAEATVDKWLASIRAALAWASGNQPGRPVGLLGLRFGATLAAMVAEQHQAIRFLILWEPVLDGRRYLMSDLRKKLVKEMMARGKPSESRQDLLEKLDSETSIDFNGYPISRRLFDGIAAADLAKGEKAYGGAVLVAGISPSDGVAKPLRQLADSYVHASVTVAALKDQPFWNLVGVAECEPLVTITSDWLAERVPAETS